jgi:isochorismate synthase EntC
VNHKKHKTKLESETETRTRSQKINKQLHPTPAACPYTNTFIIDMIKTTEASTA